ncbi:peroxisome biogenesis factor 10-like isoform X3 [Phymastichus coffea]|uniref:peroxisome biogenesis factor 10-like isoform X3 n=1 Tax=Phymastichus coffea TaxID=108790 RepID=UPI00273CA1DC|nr:peroxisome biogenesis factor 10-like isoform X3 [Phymastichus coffea]XP_058796351.1 peroxisome biogenesis factor 10-like isoform X3 [Phymastichus coffea]XP_058796352.1 peroxisome biogenesis factor 10-like isoform X3 [Phymastichus coffea]XP_058796353.1 peroxisome biogenesis factor 10-like isoform X3 [Phymastichus coffea]
MANQNKRKLRIAIQAEILRSHQRDNDFITQMNENITDLLHRYNLYRNVSRFFKSDVPAKILYFIVTSGFGNQTLGEEYTGIVQANLKINKVPSLLTRVIAAILECFGEQMLIKILEKLQITINKPSNELTPQAKLFLNTLLVKLRNVLPILILVHRGLFYMYGRYYSISKRITGVDYVKIYGPRPHSRVSYGLRVLGFATIAQCLFRLWQSRNFTDETIYDEKEFESNYSNQCQLCFNKVSDTTTPCGHLFCWTCLAEWLRARGRCPLCRESAAPSRIIPLMNL